MSGIEPAIDVERTKLRIPRPPRGLVTRPRLLDAFGEGAAPITLVCAPAGFGKTVLALDWLRQAKLPVAWVSLDRFDNDPERFFRHVAASIGALELPGARAAAEWLPQGAGSAGGAPSAELLDALAELEGRAVIVLDDLHEIEAEAVLSPLARLLEHWEAGPHLLLLSRRDPPIPLARLRLEGRLSELRADELRFTLDESEVLFQALLPHGIDRALIERLGAKTEGWVSGLRMAALVLERADNAREMVDAFTGSHRFVVEYLLEEVLAGRSEPIQRFLLETSILPRFTADACAAVLDNPDAREHLLEVEAANLFVVPLEGSPSEGPSEGPPWYRYHHLFAELLRFRLHRLHPERREVLHERASRWFELEGDVFEALEQAAQMTSTDRLVKLLDRHGMAILARSELGLLRRWLHQVPDPLDQPFPTFLQVLGWSRLLTERAPELDALFAAGSRQVESEPPMYTEEDGRRARIGLDILRAFAARYQGRFEEALTVGRTVLAKIPSSDADGRGKILYNQARVHMVLGDMAPADVLLRESFEQSVRCGMTYLILNGLAQRAVVLTETQGVYRAREVLESAVELAGRNGIQRVPAFGIVLYQIGRVHFLADDLDAADSHFDRALTHGAAGYHEARYNALLGLARVRTVQRRYDEARDLLAEAEVFLTEHEENVFAMETTLELERLRLALTLEERGVGPPLSLPVLPPEGERWTAIVETELHLRLQVALRSEQTWDEAGALALRLKAESAPRGRGIAEAVARLALAIVAKGNASWSLLDETLEFAAVRGYVRPLLELGEPARNLLRASRSRRLRPAARAHRLHLLTRFEAQDRHRATVSPSNGVGPAGNRMSGSSDPAIAPAAGLAGVARTPAPATHEPLTDRELEVLAALARGGTNKNIARRLHVSAETVRTHLKHVYAKLGVAGRREAVTRARELALVPRVRPG